MTVGRSRIDSPSGTSDAPSTSNQRRIPLMSTCPAGPPPRGVNRVRRVYCPEHKRPPRTWVTPTYFFRRIGTDHESRRGGNDDMSRDFVGALLQLNAEKQVSREQLIHTVEDADRKSIV